MNIFIRIIQKFAFYSLGIFGIRLFVSAEIEADELSYWVKIVASIPFIVWIWWIANKLFGK